MQLEQLVCLSAKRVNIIIAAILCLYPLVGMGIDLLAPSLPAISYSLQLPGSFSKNLITAYLLGYALGNFFLGFLSDVFGRRKLMVNGLFLFVIVSLLPAAFSNSVLLVIARFFQGIMMAAFAVNARAVLSDILTEKKLLQIATIVATMWGIGPILGPIIGGYLQYYFNWHACFYFYAGFGFIGLVAMFFILPETIAKKQSLEIKQIKSNFVTIITHQLFVGVVTLMGITYSILIVFNTLGPFLIQISLKQTPIFFGHLALCMGLAFLIGTLACRYLIKQLQPENIIGVIAPLLLFVSLLFLGLTYINNKNIGFITLSSLCMFLGSGIMYPAAMAKGLALFRHMAGSGSAVMNLINVLISTLTAFMMSFIYAGNATSIAWMYVLLMSLNSFCYWFVIRRKVGFLRSVPTLSNKI
jgi:Bcr/CflA subfamily drug resistance transporter